MEANNMLSSFKHNSIAILNINVILIGAVLNFDGFEKINFDSNDPFLSLQSNAKPSSWKEFSQKLLSSKIVFTEENIKKV
jgi:hypothetical protein